MLCELCQSEDAHNFHHFIPRTLHTNKWFKPYALPRPRWAAAWAKASRSNGLS
jgi:hypothetical protein